jgi:predicted TIM-barrel fold metal-dependent hydrolase
MQAMEIIDGHEHLGPESERISKPVDFFSLFSHWPYIGRDLELAGMKPADHARLLDQALSLEERWKLFEPYWKRVELTSFARPIRIAAERFYGADHFDAGNIAKISQAMAAANKPGLYDQVLRDACKIRLCIDDVGTTDVRKDLFIPILRFLMDDFESWERLSNPRFSPGTKVATLDAFVECCKAYVLKIKQEGAVGLKMAALNYSAADRGKALSAFNALRDGKLERLGAPNGYLMFQPSNPLRDYVVDEIIRFAGAQGFVIAMHIGFWGDFRNVSPLNIIPLLQRFPKVRFDLFHLGYPFIRETLMLGKGFPNAWINFCWMHIISQSGACAALDEAIDLLPSNKILGFGGDYGSEAVESVYGHLVMARENIASVLARRIEAGSLSEKQAQGLIKQWLWDNPRDLYRLEV